MATKITNIKSFTYNSVAYTGILSVSFDDGVDTTVDNKADEDLYHTSGKAVESTCTGTVEGVDSDVFADIPKGDTQTLVYTGEAVDDGSTVTHTITGVMFLKLTGNLEHAADGGASITFKAYASDGQTSPVTIADAP